jgi:hypothetical protein
MSNYFKYFPTTAHDLTNVGQRVELTNILRRFTIDSAVKDNVSVFHDYVVQAGDRPDTISHKYYGTSDYAWLILMFNEIHDALFDWPLFNQEFDNYIKGKYGSIAAAQAEVGEYRKIITQKQVLTDGTIIDERYVVVDQTTYNSLSPSNRILVTSYDLEIEKNEDKKSIKILDKTYLPLVRDEVKYIVRNGI